MKIIAMILTGLICLLCLVFLGKNIPKIKTNTKIQLLILLFILANVNGIIFLILLGLCI